MSYELRIARRECQHSNSNKHKFLPSVGIDKVRGFKGHYHSDKDRAFICTSAYYPSCSFMPWRLSGSKDRFCDGQSAKSIQNHIINVKEKAPRGAP